MSPAIITLIAWAPFLLLALIFGITFSIKGYKRGAARAGISIGVTAITCIISIFVAKLIATAIAGNFSPMIADALSETGMKLAAKELAALATSIAGAVASLILYIPVSIILFSVLKPVASFIFKRFIPAPKHVANKIGGLSLSLIDALLLTILVTLPVYGTLALADGVVDVFAKGDNETVEMISAATDPFVVDVVGVPPFSTAYDTLMSCKIGKTTVSLSETVREAVVVLEQVKVLENFKAENFNKKDILELLSSAEELIGENDLVADFVCEYLGENMPTVKMPGLGKLKLDELYPALSDSKQLKSDLPAVFNLTEAMVKSGLMEELTSKNPDVSKINAETVSKAFGNTLNHSESLATLKSNLLTTVVDSFSKEIIDEGKDEDGSVKALCDAIASIPTEPMNKEDAKKEGESFYLIVSGLKVSSNDKNAAMGLGMVLEGLARHPMVGVEKVMDAAGAIIENTDLEISESLLNKMEENLVASLNKPIGESSFGNYCNTAFITLEAFGGIASRDEADNDNGSSSPEDGKEEDKEAAKESFKNLITADKESLEAVKDTVSSDLMTDIGIEEEYADTFKEVVDATFDAIIGADCSEEEAEKEAEALGSVLEVVTGVTQNPDDTTDIVKEYTIEIVEECLDSKIVTEMILDLTEGGRTDPFGLFAGMPEDEKASVEETINEYIANAESEEKIAALEAYKLFVGIKSND